MDRATTVKDFVELVESFGSKPGFRAELLKDAARYLQEAEDVRAPALAAAARLQQLLVDYPYNRVRDTLEDAVKALRQAAGLSAAPTTPRQAVAGLTEALQETDTLAAYANAVGVFEPKWVVKEPGVRVLTGTSFEMRTDGDLRCLNVYLAGGLIHSQSTSRPEEAEKFVTEYTNTNRERLAAFGFIGQETRT